MIVKTKTHDFLLKGIICYSKNRKEIDICRGYAVCIDGKSAGVYEEIPAEYTDIEVRDYGDSLIIPGMVDLHIHAPQYAFRGTGMDHELIEWLEMQTFPEEAKYRDPAYAGKAYGIFSENMKKSATTRACIFGTIHRRATEILMDCMEESGLVSYVGKVNMDRNCPGQKISGKRYEDWAGERRSRRTDRIHFPGNHRYDTDLQNVLAVCGQRGSTRHLRGSLLHGHKGRQIVI